MQAPRRCGACPAWGPTGESPVWGKPHTYAFQALPHTLLPVLHAVRNARSEAGFTGLVSTR